VIATWLVKLDGGRPGYLSGYLIALGLVALVSVALMRKHEA